MPTIGTPFTSTAKKVMMLGSGELGKEVIIELKRYGVECIAVDSYANAPAMQVADRSHVVSMLDAAALRAIIIQEKPDLIIPEVEAIATHELQELEEEGFTVIPTAKATRLTMDREGIRRLAAEVLKLKTSPYRFASNLEEYKQAVARVELPCVVKPTMSSSGKGQSTLKAMEEIIPAWEFAMAGARGKSGKVIVEGFVDFDFEITLLTIRHKKGDETITSFCQPIGHRQERGDYQESWQPQQMTDTALQASKEIAHKVTEALGGLGLFGVELFIKGDEVYFSEVSPRPHDTGMVTLISQDQSEFALHARAILGLPIPNITQHGPSASAVILVEGHSKQVSFSNLAEALSEPDTQIKLFGKPEVAGERRMGVALARGADVEEAKAKALQAASLVQVKL